MRFLFTCIPAFGHLHAMVPYAQALKIRGHEVAFATGSEFKMAVQAAGFDHYSCGIGNASSFEALTRDPKWPAIHQRFAADPSGLAQLHAFIEILAPQMLARLPEVVKLWQPHVIVRDPLEFGGYIAAELAGIPYVLVEWAIHIPTPRIAPEALQSLRRQYGLSSDPGLESLDAHLVLSAMPESWDFEGIPHPERLSRHCCAPYDRAGSLPQSIPDLVRSGRPVVYATLGTTFNHSPDTFRAIIEAFAGEDLTGILTLGHGLDPALFGPVPENVLVANYIPQTSLLPHCDAVLFHGGFNSLHSALWHGLPMILVPMGAGDQMPNATTAVARGLGLIEQRPLASDSLRQAIRTVLGTTQFRTNAAQFQNEMRALPPLAEAAHRMEALANTRSATLSDSFLV